MKKITTDLYGILSLREIRKGRKPDNIIIAWQITLIMFIFNFQSLFFLTIALLKELSFGNTSLTT